MLKSYYQLHFFDDFDTPGKSYLSNIKMKRYASGRTTKRFSFDPEQQKWTMDENGDVYEYFHAFVAFKFSYGYRLWNNYYGKDTICPTLEEMYFTARKQWIEMDAELNDEDIIVVDHIRVGKWVTTSSLDRFIKKHNCRNVDPNCVHGPRTLINWDNYTHAI